ncbi:hypothetical protein EYF80_029901 [Liparis tanakae]|uniref:Uncharacterized protein n=1 Tax=Liparis tanakae TaxID=230148 RepID=A0A4Z2H4M6_9TELE|nr:hypothetical protein EYF80_029901 [Liparis tanakae]
MVLQYEAVEDLFAAPAPTWLPSFCQKMAGGGFPVVPHWKLMLLPWLPFLSPPSDSGGGVSMDFTQEVNGVLLHDHLVHRPPHQHGALCRRRTDIKHVHRHGGLGVTTWRHALHHRWLTSSHHHVARGLPEIISQD